MNYYSISNDNTMGRFLSTLLILSLSVPLLVNCKKDAPSVESFSIEPSTLYINDEGTQQLDVVVLPETAKKGKFFSSLVWKSDDENIASVDENGLVTGNMRGNTRITASTPDGSLMASCDVVVQLVLTDEKDITKYFEKNFALALNFENKIKDASKITYGEVKEIKGFDVPNVYHEKIISASGLEFLENIETLDLSGCVNMESVKFGTHGKLKKLVAKGCQLTSIDLRGCPALENIDLSGNKLKSFDASGFPKLYYLAINDNELEDINLNGCALLNHLFIRDNKLKSIDMSSIKLLNDNNFNYLYNPGENGEFKIINKNETSRLVSWTMVAGDEKSRVWAYNYSDKAPKIKVQTDKVSTTNDVPVTLSVELESQSANVEYYWWHCREAKNTDTGQLVYQIYSKIEDKFDTDGAGNKSIISGSKTGSITFTIAGLHYKKGDELYMLVAYDKDAATITYSKPMTITYK